MGKLTGKLVKGVLKSFGKEEVKGAKFISDEMNAKHEEMIKAIQAKRAAEVPTAKEVEAITAPEKAMEEAAPEVANRYQNITPAQRKGLVEEFRKPNDLFPEGIKPAVREEPMKPIDLPEDDDEAINTIMELIKSNKNKAKSK